MSETESLIEILKSFNAKERFFLVGQILGNPDFKPSHEFLVQLSETIQVPITGDVFAAMDYHLDWIYASLVLNSKSKEPGPFPNPEVRLDDGRMARVIRGQQEDVDFLMAFEHGDKCHIVLIEAKGVTGWSTKQMGSKAERFEEIFGKDGRAGGGAVVPHFVMVSPSDPGYERDDFPKYPDWMFIGGEIKHIPMTLPTDIRYVTRSEEDGTRNADGTHFKVEKRRW